MGVYSQEQVNLAFEVLRSDPAAVGEALRAKAIEYLVSLFPAEGG